MKRKILKHTELRKKEKTSNQPSINDPRYQQGGLGFINFCNHFIRLPIFHKGNTDPVWTPLHSLPDEQWRPGISYKTFWHQQCQVALKALEMKDGIFIHRLIVLCWQRGEGKCLKKGTKSICYDGTLKKAEDFKVGDLLMGDDNTPRKVLSIVKGKEEMFEVIPVRGESFTVTGDHKLSLKRSESSLFRRGKYISDHEEKKFIDISVKDFQKQSDFFKNNHFLYRVPIDWPEQEVPIDPYFLGVWLADGDSHRPAITTMDSEVVNYLHKYTEKIGLQLSIGGTKSKASTYNIHNGGTGNHLLETLRNENLVNNKHIPQVYKANSREIRLKILAGIIDGDGYLNRNSFQITLKREQLAEDVAFIARSLGFHAEIKKCTKGIKSTGFSGEYYCVGISGDCSVIPTIVARRKAPKRSDWKDVLVTNIKEIRSVGEQEYYGFMLDGNHRFLLSDFTVTHNSILAVLIQIWKFFCFNAQRIMLGANSKDQVKFVHYDLIRDIIVNSPLLLQAIGGMKNIQEKEIRRAVHHKGENRFNIIRAISSFSGIVSNITGYTFSEIFDMKNPKFFYQLDGSVRNIPNALGVIDSTVASRDHVLYTLYEVFTEKKDPSLFFSYRYSVKGMEQDYWNPQMNQQQLTSYQTKFPPAEFAQYFTNLWSTGSLRMFSPAQVEAIYYQYTTLAAGQMALINCLKEKTEALELIEQSEKASGEIAGDIVDDAYAKIKRVEQTLVPMSRIYALNEATGICYMDDLRALGTQYETDFAILVGIDRSDPMSQYGARSIYTVVAKGCVGSSRMDFSYINPEALEYIYFVVGLDIIEPNSAKTMKEIIIRCDQEFDGIDMICSERWGMFDMAEWCDENKYPVTTIHPSYDRQRTYFGELYTAVAKGNFKSPFLSLPGSRSPDILKEELGAFIQNEQAKWFGSPEKKSRNGIQDDVIYSIGLAIFGGLALTIDSFRVRQSKNTGFMFIKENRVYGSY